MGKKEKKEKKKKKKNDDDDDEAEGDEPAPPPPRVGRVSWALEAIDANRAGDVERLLAAYRREGAEVATQTAGGGYGGFRYLAWGATMYGGEPAGNSMLHIAVAPHNACYPNRFAIARALITLGCDVSLRNVEDKTARDLNMALVDAVYPLTRWRVADVTAWLKSKGAEQRVLHLDKWIKIFETYHTNGAALELIMTPDTWEKWVLSKLPDLTRIGFPSADLDHDKVRWIRVLTLLKSEMLKGMRLRGTSEMEMERALKAKVEAERKAAEAAAAAAEAAAAAAVAPPPSLGGGGGLGGSSSLPEIHSGRGGSSDHPGSRPTSASGPIRDL